MNIWAKAGLGIAGFVIVATIVCLVPIKQVSYALDVPYQTTETYTEMEPYTVIEPVWEDKVETIWGPREFEYPGPSSLRLISLTRQYDRIFGKVSYRGTRETIQCWIVCGEPKLVEPRKLAFPGIALELKSKDEKTWELDPSISRYVTYLTPMFVGATYAVIGIEIKGQWREQVGEKQVTKYRGVERQRTVTKVLSETRYKRVSVLDYLLH